MRSVVASHCVLSWRDTLRFYSLLIIACVSLNAIALDKARVYIKKGCRRQNLQNFVAEEAVPLFDVVHALPCVQKLCRALMMFLM